MASKQGSTFEDLTETTPVEVAHQTTGSSMTSSSSRGVGYYSQCIALIVAIVGGTANGLVLYAMAVSKQHKKHVLIFNQNALDLVNCVFVIVQCSVRMSNIDLDGTLGYWLCMLLLSDLCSWGAYVGSMINLTAISIERYLKIIHHVWAKKNLHNWMIYSTVAFVWICGLVITVAAVFPTTAVVNGVCFARRFYKSVMAQKAFSVWNFLSFYAIILFIWVFCYGKILIIIRHQAHVMTAHSGQGSNTTQNQSNKIQTNVIKTMILVCGLYAITWAPTYIYSLLRNLHSKLSIGHNGLFAVLSIGRLYICINPFIYVTKFDPVKRVLLGLIPCKNSMQAPEIIVNT